MAQQENELKYELSEESYHGLLAVTVAVGEPRRFNNAYFHVDCETGRRDWVLRLRHQEGRPGELTLKVGRQTSPGIFISTEYTAYVDSPLPGDWEETEPVRVFRQEISMAPIIAQGEARNERRVVEAPLGPVPHWEIDRTELPNGKVCYELEIEYPPDASPTPEQLSGFRAQLEDWLFSEELKASPSGKTKYRRFLESLGRFY